MAYNNLNDFVVASEPAANSGQGPDYKGTIEVAAWWNTDADGNKFLSVQIGHRAKLVKNEQKLDSQMH